MDLNEFLLFLNNNFENSNKITKDTFISSFIKDSLDFVEFYLLIEEKFNIEIHPFDSAMIKTVEELYNMVTLKSVFN